MAKEEFHKLNYITLSDTLYQSVYFVSYDVTRIIKGRWSSGDTVVTLSPQDLWVWLFLQFHFISHGSEWIYDLQMSVT